MFNKVTSDDSELRNMIRKIVKEEISHVLNKSKDDLSISSKQTEQVSYKISSKVDSQAEDIDGTWAVFGTPQPDPAKRHIKQERPRALPGWSEPFRPDFEHFETPPFLASKRIK